MGELILDSLEIKNFRCFEQLGIEKLGRVNLIVGKNSVGKTSLLESLYLYARKGSPRAISQLLLARNEEEDTLYSGIKHLFYGRDELKNNGHSKIKIGSAKSDKKILLLSLAFEASNLRHDEGEDLEVFDDKPHLNVVFEGVPRREIKLDENISPLSRSHSKYIFVLSNGLSDIEIRDFWENIVLTQEEEDVVQALRIISRDVERVAVSSDSNSAHFVRVKIANSKKPIPLRNLGDGINRVFGIVLALVNCKDGMLLIDEIENGLHYSIQERLWKIIFEVAHRLNVQVFATTHSWDCIEAFQAAAVENKQEEGVLIRLVNNEGEIVPTIFDEEDLTIMTEELLEVR